MKPGDLVHVSGNWKNPILIGVIIKESDPRITQEDKRHRWWTVLCEGNELVDEVEEMLEVIYETR